MPSAEETMTSWADQVELTETGELPPSSEDFNEDSGIKTSVEYKYNEDGKKVKVTKTYKVEVRRVSKSIARRKAWRKYGLAADDPPGPNPANTVISEDIFMQFVHNKEQQLQDHIEEDPLAKLKGQKIVTCRICHGDHWTTKCPYKDTLVPLQEALQDDTGDKEAEPTQEPAAAATPTMPGSKTGKYVPPSLRNNANRGRGETMKRDEASTIRVTNLSEETKENDLQELFRPFGPISRIYLAKDKKTGHSKGFAFINYGKREDAARAIVGVSGFGYDHLILNVEWAKPSGTA